MISVSVNAAAATGRNEKLVVTRRSRRKTTLSRKLQRLPLPKEERVVVVTKADEEAEGRAEDAKGLEEVYQKETAEEEQASCRRC